MKSVGTVVRGLKSPIIKEGDNLEEIIIDVLLKAKESEGFEFQDRDIIGITEGVVGISEGNFATTKQMAEDIKNKFPDGHIGIVHPSPLSRNRLGVQMKAIAKASKKLTFLLSFPLDEVGNELFSDELLEASGLSVSDTFDLKTYKKYFGNFKHPFTGVNYVEYYHELVTSQDCEIEFIFSNDPKTILNYTKNVLVCNVHERFKYKRILKESGANTVLGLDDILTQSIEGSGYNPRFGLLGANRINDDKVKLFPAFSENLVNNIQKRIFDMTGKTVEVLIYGDGAFKNPLGNWELADPVVSPFYTKGLEGTPNEIKIKYLSDNKFSHLKGEELSNAIREEVKNKSKNLKGSMSSLGTTPARLTDLIGSLCDLTSGSGDKGTPIVFIQGYFSNYAE